MPDQRLGRLALPLVLLLAALPRLWRLDGLSFWFDEAATLHYAQGWPWDIWGQDTHPPLYYTLIGGWRLLGESEYVLRLSSVLLSLGAVAAVHQAGVVMGGRLAGLLAALLLALSPFSMQYAQELRMYALLECTGALALLGLVRLLADPAAAAGPFAAVRWRWGLYVLGSVLVLYSHNMGFLWPLVANLAVLLAWWRQPARRRLARRWVLANGVVLLVWMAYWPALYPQVTRVVGDFWMWQPTAARALGDAGFLALGLGPVFDVVEWVLGLLMLALAAFGLWRLRPRGLALALLLLWLLPPLLEYGLDLVARPLFAVKTVIWSALPFVLALGFGLAELLRAGRRRAPVWMLASLALVVALLAVRGAMLNNYVDRWTKADWRGAVAALALDYRPGDRIMLNPLWELMSYSYYAGRQPLAGRPALPPRELDDVSGGPFEGEVARLRAGERLWVLNSLRYRNSGKDMDANVAGLQACATVAGVRHFFDVDLLLILAQADCEGGS